jgi:hypothetical protein
LLAVWVGVVWGVWARVEEGKRRRDRQETNPSEADPESSVSTEHDIGSGIESGGDG